MGFVDGNSRLGAGWRIRVWIVIGATAAFASLALAGGQRQGVRTRSPKPGEGVAAGMGERPAATIRFAGGPVLAGSSANFFLFGRAGSTTPWQFGVRGVVLTQGRVTFDRDGLGRCRLVMPTVRHRMRCRFVLPSLRGPAVGRDVVVYPARMLSNVQKSLSDLDIGVLDSKGRIARALTAEQVVFQHLRTQLQEEAFDGDMLILGGFQRAPPLIETCRTMLQRVRRGMIAIVINPPAAWRAFGIERVELKPPLAVGATSAKGFATVLQAEDIGRGPWTSALRSTGGAKALVWVSRRPATSRASRPARPASRPAAKQLLILARRIGKGWVITALLPQLDGPADNAVGRAALDETVLWILAEKAEKARKAAQQRHRKE